MRSWKPFLLAVLAVVACSDDSQEPVLQRADQRSGGQPGWRWSNPQPQGNDLNDVDFFDQGVGFAVGTFGAIICTLDGGMNWELQKSGTTDWLSGVAASGARSAVAVGANGTILRTINRGVTWERRQSGVTAGLLDVDFADANHGIAVGEDAILLTNNAGASWTPADLTALPHDAEGHISFNRVSMVDANTAFALGTNGLYATPDGGATWVERPTPRGNLHGVCFTDTRVGTVVGSDGTVLRTHDGGITWTLLDVHTAATLRGVAFVDANHGIIAGGDHPFAPYFMYTADGGETWNYGPSGSPGPGVLIDFRNVSMPDADTGVVVGGQGNIFRTADAGQTWENQAHFSALRLSGISFANASDGIAVGPATIMRTRDGGATWTRYIPGPLFLNDVSYFGPTGVVIVGWDAISLSGVLLRSTDGGFEWTTTPASAGILQAIDFADGLTGNTVGSGGVILRTADAGVTWLPQPSGTTEDLNDVAMLNAEMGVAVGDNATIVRTTNGGASWQGVIQPGLSARLAAVDFADSEVGFVVGGSRTILHTRDGGLTWVNQESGITDDHVRGFADVVCVDRNSAVVLTALQVLVTRDGGDHWAPTEPFDAIAGPYAIAISGKKTVTTAGEFGVILQNSHVLK